MSHKPYGPYEKYLKRPIDFLCGLAAVVVFSWLYLILMVLGVIFMGGNPFFTQERPGKDGKLFKLIKFRSMSNQKDKNGNLLPDDVRLNKYGRFLRKTSLDELPEAFNIMKGDMSVVGPRPLLVQYLPRYNSEQKHRHDVRPGLSGYAQVHGRNDVSWEDKFAMDVWYVNHVTFLGDVILWETNISTSTIPPTIWSVPAARSRWQRTCIRSCRKCRRSSPDAAQCIGSEPGRRILARKALIPKGSARRLYFSIIKSRPLSHAERTAFCMFLGMAEPFSPRSPPGPPQTEMRKFRTRCKVDQMDAAAFFPACSASCCSSHTRTIWPACSSQWDV